MFPISPMFLVINSEFQFYHMGFPHSKIVSFVFFQLALFVVVVQLPLFFTGRMAYVDLGWPAGLLVLAAHVALGGPGWWPRRYVAGRDMSHVSCAMCRPWLGPQVVGIG